MAFGPLRTKTVCDLRVHSAPNANIHGGLCRRRFARLPGPIPSPSAHYVARLRSSPAALLLLAVYRPGARDEAYVVDACGAEKQDIRLTCAALHTSYAFGLKA